MRTDSFITRKKEYFNFLWPQSHMSHDQVSTYFWPWVLSFLRDVMRQTEKVIKRGGSSSADLRAAQSTTLNPSPWKQYAKSRQWLRCWEATWNRNCSCIHFGFSTDLKSADTACKSQHWTGTSSCFNISCYFGVSLSGSSAPAEGCDE